MPPFVGILQAFVASALNYRAITDWERHQRLLIFAICLDTVRLIGLASPNPRAFPAVSALSLIPVYDDPISRMALLKISIKLGFGTLSVLQHICLSHTYQAYFFMRRSPLEVLFTVEPHEHSP